MDAKAIVREMMKNGQSKQEIISNLQELGISDAEKYYDQALSEDGKPTISPGFSEDRESSIFTSANDAAEKEAKDILENETKPLFGDAKPKKEPQTSKEVIEDIPELEITSIGSEGEKIESVGGGGMFARAEKPEIMKPMPKTSIRNTDELERKLDDMISLLKAVYDIDKKILDANRDVLLRLKSGKS